MVTTLRIDGEVDLSNAVQIQVRLLRTIIRHSYAFPGDSIEIDCSGLEFIDSSGLGMLVRVGDCTGRRVVLLDVPARCRRVFEITALDAIFELRSSIPVKADAGH